MKISFQLLLYITNSKQNFKRINSFVVWILISDVETPISIYDNDALEGMNYVFIEFHNNWFIVFASQGLKAVV